MQGLPLSLAKQWPERALYQPKGRPAVWTYRHLPAGPPRGVVVLAHGLGHHAQHHAHVGAAFAERGFVALAIDFPGHGRSLRDGETPALVRSVKAFAEVMVEWLEQALPLYSDVPRFVWGHSMGGGVVLHVMAQEAARPRLGLSGWMLLAPLMALGEGQASAFLIGLTKVMKVATPALPVEKDLILDGVQTKDQSVVDFYKEKADRTLGYGRMTAGTAGAVVDHVSWAAQKTSISQPYLLIHGENDSIVLPETTLIISEFAPEAALHPLSQRQLWRDVEHDMLHEHEPIWRRVVAEQLRFMDAAGAAAAASKTTTGL